jgi:hypothetical protein
LVAAVLATVPAAGAEDPPAALDLVRPPALAAAADFAVGTPGGKTLRLADLRGRIVLLNFCSIRTREISI